MKNTSISLGARFEGFVAAQIEGGRYSTASEVIRDGLRLLEEREQKIAALRKGLELGEKSGPSDYTLDRLLAELDADS